jgi:hypothetical protein
VQSDVWDPTTRIIYHKNNRNPNQASSRSENSFVVELLQAKKEREMRRHPRSCCRPPYAGRSTDRAGGVTDSTRVSSGRSIMYCYRREPTSPPHFTEFRNNSILRPFTKFFDFWFVTCDPEFCVRDSIRSLTNLCDFACFCRLFYDDGSNVDVVIASKWK